MQAAATTVKKDEKSEAMGKEIKNILLQFEEERKKNAETLNSICRIYDEIEEDPRKSGLPTHKLGSKHEKAQKDIEREIVFVKKALELIQEQHKHQYLKVAAKKGEKSMRSKGKAALMSQILQKGISLPLWIGRTTEIPPALCGAIPAEPDYVAQVGDMVAALATVSGENENSENENAENENNWILAEVTGYDEIKQEYKVDDIDKVAIAEHLVHRTGVIPLPLMRANPETHPEAIFPKGALVFALYPQTTCFYKAVVHETPQNAHEPYSLLFEDVSCKSGFSPPKKIHQHYVINYIENDTDDNVDHGTDDDSYSDTDYDMFYDEMDEDMDESE